MNGEFFHNKQKIWQVALFSFLLTILWIYFLFQNTFYGMVLIWSRSETFAHGYLVFPIVIWLIWRKRHLLALRVPKANFLFLIPLALVSFLWFLGDLVYINSVTQLTAIALVVLAIFSIFGWNVTSVIIFPLLFLFFSVPLGEFLLPVLMEWTAKFTVIAIRWSGIPVYQDGLQFIISSGSWSVVEACSGVRYLISSFMIGTLYAYLNYQKFNRRLIFICVSLVVPIVANWMRAYLIVMLGHFSGNTLAVGFDHIIYGWVFFGFVIALMFLIGSRWTEDVTIDIFEDDLRVSKDRPNSLKLICVCFLISCLVAIPVFWSYFISKNIVLNAPVLEPPKIFNSGWIISSVKLNNFKSGFIAPSAEISETYNKKSSNVGVHIAYYRGQNYEKKLVNPNNFLIDASDKVWSKSSTERYVINFSDVVLPVKLRRWNYTGVTNSSIDHRLQEWQFYWVNDSFVAGDYQAKIYGALQRLLGRGDDSAVITLYAVDDESAKIALENFLENNYLEIKTLLENVRAK
jgi:exosortase A